MFVTRDGRKNESKMNRRKTVLHTLKIDNSVKTLALFNMPQDRIIMPA